MRLYFCAQCARTVPEFQGEYLLTRAGTLFRRLCCTHPVPQAAPVAVEIVEAQR